MHDNAGRVIGCHYRTKNHRWAYTKGIKGSPLIIGDLTKARVVHIHEGEWDGFAQVDKERNYSLSQSAMIITRGAGNAGRLTELANLIRRDATIYVWPQNDPPNDNAVIPSEEWFKTVCNSLHRELCPVRTPDAHKDLNDWIGTGASWEDLQDAIDAAEPISPISRESSEECNKQSKPPDQPASAQR